MTPRKVRAVAGLLRKLSVNEAEAHLLLIPRRAGVPMLKLLRSAVAGAREKKLDLSRLFVESVRVDQGPMLKRYLARARGSASPIQKKMCHITLVLGEAASPFPQRFTMATPKKVKTGPSRKAAPKQKEGEEEHENEIHKPKGPGFFKRTFSRKAGFAK